MLTSKPSARSHPQNYLLSIGPGNGGSFQVSRFISFMTKLILEQVHNVKWVPAQVAGRRKQRLRIKANEDDEKGFLSDAVTGYQW
ncbi:unnamed protein product [Camellia sinensis]